MKKKFKIGTRASKLALWQANWVQAQLNKYFPDIEIEIIKITTKGDKILDRPLALVGGKGLFVKEIEKALIDKDIDIAVHSMKDMPGILPEGLIIGAIPERENPYDVLVSRDNIKLSDLPLKAKIGTSSLRRSSQLKNFRPDLEISSIRGNLETRIKKLNAGEFDAIILAAAGIKRLGMENLITEYIDEDAMIPAVGQGALCIETRENDPDIEPVISKLNHEKTATCVKGERAFLNQIEGSCHIPVGCFAKFVDQNIVLTGIVASEDGKKIIKKSVNAEPDTIIENGKKLADTLLESGAKEILENLNTND
ncbi:MAG: hydroxymethylbilane synthase [Desulfobacteraceae bacterium]|nr:hydroxymethylbilane synthase [Desulfobacteraceae bacterium]